VPARPVPDAHAPVPAAAVARSRALAEPRFSPDGSAVGWLEAAEGRVDLVVAPAAGGPIARVSGERPVTPVGAYGGGGWCFAPDGTCVYAAADGDLVIVAPGDPGGGAPRILPVRGRAAAPAVDPAGRTVAIVVDTGERCDVALLALDGSDADAPVRLSRADYAWDPAWSPDGATLAWHEWDLPAMPWDASRVALARPGTAPRVVAGGDGIAVGQPRFSPDGTSLAYVCDRTGFANVWVSHADGTAARPLLEEPCEHAEPSWGPGQRSYAWSPDGATIALVRNERGFGRLVLVPVAGRAPGGVRRRSRGWHHGVEWHQAGIVAVRSGGRTPPNVVLLDPTDEGRAGRRTLGEGGDPAVAAPELPEPEIVGWTAPDGTRVEGLLWRPTSAATRAPPPLLVDVHGGPTGQAVVGWSPRTRFFTSRGWAVLAPNPRGSTGYGRSFVRALDGEWGSADVDDVVAGITAAGREAWGDGERVAIMGGSSGGLTALLVALRRPPVVRAVVSSYGVTDLIDLAATTHRFESRYLDTLVGLLPADAARYRDRSPAAHAHELRVPALVLQGDADEVVPPSQARALVAAARAAGAPVEYHEYAGEGHGWKQPATIVDALERIDAFLGRWVLAP